MAGIYEISRRDVLKLGTVGTAALMTGQIAWAKEQKIPIGVQLWMLKSVMKKNDLPASFKAIKAAGVDGVEFAGYYGKSAAELKKMLDDAGLKCCGTHTRLNTLDAKNLKKTVEFNKVLGNKYLIVPGMPLPDKATCIKNAKLLTEVAASIKDDGLVTGYHAHGGDFKMADGKTKWDHVFENAGPDVVMQMDTGDWPKEKYSVPISPPYSLP